MTKTGSAAAVAALLLASAPCAQEGEAKGSDLDRVQALQQEFTAANKAWMQEYREASKEERTKLFQTRPQPAKWFDKFHAVITNDPKSEAAAEAAIWIVSNRAATGPNLDKTIGVLLTNHIERPSLDRVCQVLARVPSPSAVKLLETAMKSSPHVKVKGVACFSLAESLRYQSGTARTLKTAKEDVIKNYTTYYGREAVDILRSADPAKLAARAETLYEKVQSTPEFAKLSHYRGTLGAAAKSNLFELRSLSIGKTAPDIVGEDVDGNPMKLSDYRGKVVVLDFWGDW
ncbi:MAG: redoxin domain-containing protein [Planctomycetes bacterium]|nr:redoxin domain-containing protein [Planctomycetota bacterium]